MKKFLSIILIVFAFANSINAQEFNNKQQQLLQNIFEYLQTSGYKPQLADNYIKFNYNDLIHCVEIDSDDTNPMYVAMYLRYGYNTIYTLEAIKRVMNDINFYKSVRLLAFEDNFRIYTEVYLNDASSFNNIFQKLLKQMHAADKELNTLIENLDSEATDSVAVHEPYLLVNDQTAISKTYGAEGGSEVFQVNTNVSEWNTWGIPTWCSVVDRTSTSFRLKYEANTTGKARSDYMKIKANGKEVRIDIKQEGTTSKSTSAAIKDITIAHNITLNGVKGMQILIDFTVRNMLNLRGTCNAYFYTSDGSFALLDANGSYNTVSGKVCCSGVFTPIYQDTDFTDYKLFIPYSELHMGSGTHALKFFVSIFDNKGNEIAQSDWIDFRFTY